MVPFCYLLLKPPALDHLSCILVGPVLKSHQGDHWHRRRHLDSFGVKELEANDCVLPHLFSLFRNGTLLFGWDSHELLTPLRCHAHHGLLARCTQSSHKRLFQDVEEVRCGGRSVLRRNGKHLIARRAPNCPRRARGLVTWSGADRQTFTEKFLLQILQTLAKTFQGALHGVRAQGLIAWWRPLV